MSNLYVQEYASVGESHSSVIPAPKGFVKQQIIPLSSTHAETGVDFASNTRLIKLKNEGTATCFYKLGKASDFISGYATTTDRAVLGGETEDIYVEDDIKAGAVRLSVVTA